MRYFLIPLFALMANCAMAQLTINESILTPLGKPIKIAEQLTIKLQVEAYLVHPYQMKYFLSLHHYILDSIPDLEQVTKQYEAILTEKDKDYQVLFNQTKVFEKMTADGLSKQQAISDLMKKDLLQSSNSLAYALDKTLRIQDAYVKDDRKRKLKNFGKAVGFLATGAWVGFILGNKGE